MLIAYNFIQNFTKNRETTENSEPTHEKEVLNPDHFGDSKVTNTADKFVILVNCSPFKPEEIEVKTIGNNVVIHGEHDERPNKHGTDQRKFTRLVFLPIGCEPEKVVARLKSNGLLIVEAPKNELPPPNERKVPIFIDTQPAIKK